MKVEQFGEVWNIVDNDGLVINSFQTNGEAWSWLERHETDPLWVKSTRKNRQQVSQHRKIKAT
jgi:hypothetical protein